MTSSKKFNQQSASNDPETDLDNNSDDSIETGNQKSLDDDDDFDGPLDDIDTFGDLSLDDDDDDDY
jgi:hypothetical protein